MTKVSDTTGAALVLFEAIAEGYGHPQPRAHAQAVLERHESVPISAESAEAIVAELKQRPWPRYHTCPRCLLYVEMDGETFTHECPRMRDE